MDIFWLHDNLSSDTLENIGGKAKGLHYLSIYGFQTPKAFVVTNIENEQQILELKDYWKKSGLKKVSVRSSATLEDGIDFSSAGQYKSFLNIDNDEDFIEAVKGCLMSLEDETIINYRKFFRQGKSKMSIVIQEMVDAKYAGVSFSINPLTKDDEVIIEAVEGLGEQLVSGLKEAFAYKLSRENPKFNQKFLEEKQLQEIYDKTIKAENKWQIPLDLEWAIDEYGNLFWLQARPITTLGDPTIDELDSTLHLPTDTITNHNVGEMLPGAVTPLTISTVVYSIDYGLRKMLKVVGVAKKIDDVPEAFCISNYQGHLFFNMRYIYRMTKTMTATDRKSIDLGICGQELETPFEDDFKEFNKFKKGINFLKYMNFLMSNKKARKRVKKLAESINFDLDSSVEDLLNQIKTNLPVLNDIMLNHYITSAHSGAMGGAIFAILEEDIKNHDEIKSLIAGVLEGIDDIESVDILKSMKIIADEALLDNPEVKNYDVYQLLDYLEQSTGNVYNAYVNFLNKHGHRSVKEAELRSPGWKDDKISLMENIQMLLKLDKLEISKEEVNLDENKNKILKNYQGGKKKALNYFINSARDGSRNREYSKSKLIVAVDKFKQAYKALAKKLVNLNALPDEDLIYFLKQDELEDFIYNRNSNLIKKANIRRRLFKEQEKLKFNHVNYGKPEPIELNLENLSKGAVLKGTTLSRGKVFGKARVVLTIEDAKELKAGEIMISGYTDIGWSPYYAIIGGLITEVGSALSHGAVVAREYALPLVSNITHVTHKIKTGDLIELDADEGTITIVE